MPTAEHLFKVGDKRDVTKLPEEQASALHRTMTQLLLLSRRARWDIQVTVAFLTTHIKSPDKDNWDKLNHVLNI